MSDPKANGGTSFHSAIEEAIDSLKSKTASHVMIFTDGELSIDDIRANKRRAVSDALKDVQGLDAHSAAVLTEHLVDKLPEAATFYATSMIPIVTDFITRRAAAHVSLGVDQPELTAPEVIALSEAVVTALRTKVQENSKPIVFLSFDRSGSI